MMEPLITRLPPKSQSYPTPSLASTASLSDSTSSASSFEEDALSETRLEGYMYPKFGTGELPSQADASKWLKYLIYVPIVSMVTMVVSTEFWMRYALNHGIVAQIESVLMKAFHDKVVLGVICASFLIGLISSLLSVDVYSFFMLWHGKHRRALPADPKRRLIHAVVVCQYKEPLEVLDATIESLVESTRAHDTIIVLACEARDPHADQVFAALESKFSFHFRNFLKTTHQLAPGEVVGKSSNENYAVRELFKYAEQECLNPFNVMVTVCDADSLFDRVFLEQVEAEFWRMPDGKRAIYNAPINTYRNFGDCNVFVQAVEISRCHYDTFAGMSFRPSQSNYSLTLGFCHETGYWDPTNTAEDFHTAIKAMAITGQGKTLVVPVWSLVLNDSVCTFQDRWTQGQRHMWGVEECAWVFNLFFHLRFRRWLSIMNMTFGQMLLGKTCIPYFLFFLLPSVQTVFFSLESNTQWRLIELYLAKRLFIWIQTVLREVALRYFILSDRKHMQKVGWANWFLLATPMYIVVEEISLWIFFTCATWSMLWHAASHTTLRYVTAPKAFSASSGVISIEDTLLYDGLPPSDPRKMV